MFDWTILLYAVTSFMKAKCQSQEVNKTPSSSVLLGEESFALLYIGDDGVAPRFPASGAH